jgi:FtsZ-binding cell division protein ZapB
MNRTSKTTRGLVGAAALLGAGLLSIGASTVQEGSGRVEEVRTLLQELVETRRVISDEKRDWTIGREVLQDRIDLVEAEIAGLRERIAEAEQSISEADAKRAELTAENERLSGASQALGGVVRGLEERTRALLARLPEPLRERVKPISQRLPADPEATKAGLGERFLNIIGILNEADKFHREVSVNSEVRTLEDGTSVEVTALYVGIGQAYYVNGDGTLAGVGSASADDWSWKPANEAAADVARAIAILQNEQEASYVPLPVQFD